MPMPEEILATCIQEGPGTPGPERGRAAAQRVRLQTKKGRSTYRPDHRRATQQQAQDAAVLCRWLNAEAALPARSAAVPPPATPEQVDDLMNTMLASHDPRLLIAMAHVEAHEGGHVVVSAALAPRHQDWTGISPMWQRADSCETLLTAGPGGRPNLVVIHEGNSRQLLTGPEAPVPVKDIPEGAPSLLARILRHHGAATIGWLSFESQRGEDPDSHTWANWHYAMPEELTKPPEGWTLSRNLLHSWLIQDTGQATSLAMYAAANADGAVGMAEQAREEKREAAARGAAAAARLMADRAQKCLDQGRMLARQGVPQENSPQEIRELSTRIHRTRQRAQALPAPPINPKSQANQDQLWYADACHRLLRHKSLTTMADAMLEGIGGPASGNDYHRYLMTLSAQQICAWPSDNIYEIPGEYPIGHEPDPELASAVRLCEEQTHTVLAHMLVPLNSASPTDISPYLEDYPELAQRLRSTMVPAVGCDAGFEYARYAAAPPEIGPVSASVGWTGYFWRGRRIFKGAAEAYPMTFPPQMAAGHTMLLEMRFAALVSDDPDAFYNPRLMPFYSMYMAMDAAANNGWHTIADGKIAQVDAAAQAEGLPPEQVRAVFAALTGGDPALANYLGYNSPLPSVVTAPPAVTHQGDPDPHGRDLGTRQAPPPPLRISREAAAHIRDAAIAAGFPSRHVARITGTG